MRFNKKSIYALNKTSEYIICPSVIDEDRQDTAHITPEDIPDFDYWKALSDENYHETEMRYKRTSRLDVTIHPLEESDHCASESLEDEYFDRLDQQESPATRTKENALTIMELCLTKIQYTRFYQHHYLGCSTREIAKKEGKNQKTIVESLQSAEKKIKKFLSEG